MVATALTVYGIETVIPATKPTFLPPLQQLLPFTVLKLIKKPSKKKNALNTVATALTVYGIETAIRRNDFVESDAVATALTVYGIETFGIFGCQPESQLVATALTVYGIETQ